MIYNAVYTKTIDVGYVNVRPWGRVADDIFEIVRNRDRFGRVKHVNLLPAMQKGMIFSGTKASAHGPRMARVVLQSYITAWCHHVYRGLSR